LNKLNEVVTEDCSKHAGQTHAVAHHKLQYDQQMLCESKQKAS